MGKPIHHAESSAKKFGGEAKDYLKIHEQMDSSKSGFSDLRHRALTHNSWFINVILPQIFGSTIKNSDGRAVSVVEIAEWHILEDFGVELDVATKNYRGGFIPTAQDYLGEIEFQAWMDNGKNGAIPPSHSKLKKYISSMEIPHIELTPDGSGEDVWTETDEADMRQVMDKPRPCGPPGATD